ncbi:MAG: methylmalonyl Co-A mutase-associated GTPase MeaB [Pseudomonadota bacterium]
MSPLADVVKGGKRALALALSELETRPGDPKVTALLDLAFNAPRGPAIGLTGPPGVGKSTLADALIRAWRARGLSVGVIAVDPSSRASGGALLGDRTRITTDPEDGGVFLRSMAARDRLGGVAAITWPAMVLMRALFDRVLVETVGVGQSETAIAGLCDTTALCAQPGSGDALQFMKAGVMEVPDLVIVTKADLEALARRAVADLKGALSVTSGEAKAPEVLACSALDGRGIDEIVTALARLEPAGHRSHRHRAQAAAWAQSAIMEAFGHAGVAALARQSADPSQPFAAMSALRLRLDAAVAQALQDLDGTGLARDA